MQQMLNDTGLGWINKTGTTKFALISSRDIDSNIPDGAEYIWFGARTSVGGTSVVAKLIVTFAAEETPLVTTVAPTGIKDSYCVGHGNVTAGGAILEKGFEYGLVEEADWSVRTSITSGEGAYSLTVSGLEPETKYYIRAWATNSYGTAYGEWLDFTTTASASYGVYSETNTASYRLYVSDDEAIAWQGYKGPYSGKQTLINITDITNKTKGGKVLKILPSAKGTWHICVTLKEELKS